MNIDVENVQHEDDFIVMMEVRVNEMITQALCYCMCALHSLQAFGQSFVEADINVFRENITALRVLHDKRKLFFKVMLF